MDLRHISLSSSSENLQEGAHTIVSRIRPEWKDPCYKVFTNGTTNKLIGVYPSGGSLSEMILVRVYGEGSDKLIDRDSELNVMSLLHSLDLSAPVHAIYGNGFAYGYTPGTVITMKSVRDTKVYPLLIKELVRFHKTTISTKDFSSPQQTAIWSKMTYMLDLIPESAYFSILQKELEDCKSYFEDLSSQDAKIAPFNGIVLCHNDLLLDNIIFDESRNRVSLIDFEYVFPNYGFFDIANHFCEFVGLSKDVDYERNMPSEAFQKTWIELYLKEMELPTSEIHSAYVLVQKYMLLSHLFWGIWALVQSNISNIDFEFGAYGERRIQEYHVQKNKWFHMKF